MMGTFAADLLGVSARRIYPFPVLMTSIPHVLAFKFQVDFHCLFILVTPHFSRPRSSCQSPTNQILSENLLVPAWGQIRDANAARSVKADRLDQVGLDIQSP